MELRPDLLLRAAAKAMADVVLPALDADNKLAQEQGQLVLASLNLVLQRLPQMYRFDCDQLERSVGFAAQVGEIAERAGGGSDAAAALVQSASAGAEVLARAQADPAELQAANLNLYEKIGAVVTAICAEAPDAVLAEVGRAVTANAADQLLRDRAWVAPQGWEPGAAALPAVETLITRPPG
ncbi:MAG: hypothetical protein V4579_06875 [Pseudomonadota bacterium]